MLRQDGAVQPATGLPFDYPPAWNRALCLFIGAEKRGFRGAVNSNGTLSEWAPSGLGSSPLRWVYTYRIANLSTGHVNLGSRVNSQETAQLA